MAVRRSEDTGRGGAGRVRMIDVGGKRSTRREATASARVVIGADALRRLQAGRIPKGDVLTVARVAGIAAAKRTADLLPLCHPLPISMVEVDAVPEPPDAVAILARVRVQAQTGVEMEALTAAAVAALTVYDMCKSVSRAAEIAHVRLESKSGGRSGDFVAKR